MSRARRLASKNLVDGLRVSSAIGVAGIYTTSQFNLLQALAGLYQVLDPDEILKLSRTPAPGQPGTSATVELCRDITGERARRKFLQLSSKFEPFFQSVLNFWPVIDVLVSAKPEVAALVWGGCKFLVIAALNYFDYFEQISKAFEKLGDLCSYFDRFLEILPDSSRLHSALADYYAVSIRFSTSALRFLKKSTTRQIFKAILQPFKLSFQELEEELDRQQKLVNKEIKLAMGEVALRTRQEISLFRIDERNNNLLMIQNHAENQSTHSNVMTKLNGIENSALQQHALEKSMRRKRLLEAISKYEYRSSFSSAYEKRHKNTGLWLFEIPEYKEWNEDSESSGVWCYGIPGAGKTVLAAGVIDHLFVNQQNKSTSISYVFCDYALEESMKTSVILQSLIKQILSVFEEISPEMERNFEKNFVSGHRVPKIEDLYTMLLDIAQIPDISYIIIDGLDECRSDDRKQFLTCMNDLMKNSKSRIKVIIFSREKVDISRSLKDFRKISLSSAKNHSDIEVFIRETIEEKVKGDLKVGPGMVEEINDALIKGSGGMFLWVKFQIVEICRENNDDDIRLVLQSLPEGLDGTYLRILKRIVDNHKPEIAKKVFTWLSVVRRPITLDELNEAVAFEPGCSHWGQGSHQNDSLNMLRNCGNLVVHGHSDDTIQFAHYTVLEFLESKRAAQAVRDFFIDRKKANLYVGLICLTYLSFPDFETKISRISKAKEDTKLPAVTEWVKSTNNRHMKLLSKVHPKRLLLDRNSNVSSARIIPKKKEDPVAEVLSAQFCLLKYVAQNWIYHCCELSNEDRVNWPLFHKLLFGRQLPFNHLPWAYQDHHQNNAYDTDNFWWAVEADNPAVLKAIFSRLRNDTISSSQSTHNLVQEGLHLACVKGKELIISHLLELGARLDEPHHYTKRTALQSAAGQGHLATVFRLIECRADVNASPGSSEDGVTALEAAAGGGHFNVVSLLLQNDAQVNANSGTGRTALEAAATGGHIEIVSFLLQNNADIDAGGGIGRTALAAAAENGHLDVVSFLLENNALINTGHGRTALAVAAENGHLDIVNLLLQKDAKVNANHGTGRTALEGAAENGYLDIVKVLLQKDAHINTSFGRPALGAAAENGHLDVVSLLIQNGAKVDANDGIGRTALAAAAENGHLQVVDLLLQAGALVNTSHERTALGAAAGNGHVEIVNLLLQKAADVNARDKTGRTALEAAAEKGYLDITQLLLQKGAHVNTYSGRPALEAAAGNGHFDVVSLLITNGATINAIDGTGRTALEAAAENGHLKVVSLLIKHRVRINEIDVIGRTALEAAAENGHLEVVSILLENSSNINANDGIARTALEAAAENGHLAVVTLLVEKGANIDPYKGNRRTALEAAAENGHLEVVSLLIQKGANIDPNNKIRRAALDAGAENEHPEVSDPDNEIRRAALEAGVENGNPEVVDPNDEIRRTTLEATAENVHPEVADSNDGIRRTALEAAAENGHLDVVSLLIENGANINTNDGTRRTALEAAAENGHVEIVSLLIDNGVDIDPNDKSRRTALEAAAENGHLAVVDLLIQNSANINANDGVRRTALEAAAENGHHGVVSLLLEKGAHVVHTDNKRSTLVVAAEKGHLDVVNVLLRKHAKNYDGRLALEAAAENGHLAVVNLLLQIGTSINKHYGQAALEATIADGPHEKKVIEVAARNGHLDVVSLLLQNSAQVDTFYRQVVVEADTVTYHSENGAATRRDYGRALAAAAGNGHLDVVILLSQGNLQVNVRDVDVRDVDERTALVLAIVGGHPDVRMLVQAVANMKAPPSLSWGPTALQMANAAGYMDIVKFLAASADVNASAGLMEGQTALEMAARWGQLSVVKFLLTAKSGPTFQVIHRALEAADAAGYADVVELLRVASGRNRRKNDRRLHSRM